MKIKKCFKIQFEPSEEKGLNKLIRKARKVLKENEDHLEKWKEFGDSNDPNTNTMIQDFTKYVSEDKQNIEILTNGKIGLFCEKNDWEQFTDVVVSKISVMEESDKDIEVLWDSIKKNRNYYHLTDQ